jgi:hypothetical protein
MPCDRRTYLSLLAGAAGTTGVTGCLGTGGDETPTDGSNPGAGPDDGRATGSAGSPTETNATRGRESAVTTDLGTGGRSESRSGSSSDGRGEATSSGRGEATISGGTLVLERIHGRPEVPLTVYSRSLARIVRSAATTDGTVRTHVATGPENPRARLPTFDAVEIVDEVGDADGIYDLAGEGGTRYRMGLSADPVEDPGGTVVPVSSLSGDRRSLVEEAIDGGSPGVYPETELGEWARREAFGTVFEREGESYRVTETHATDAAFFSNRVWYVLTLAPADPADPVTFRLPDLDAAVREELDPVVDWVHREAPEKTTKRYEQVPDAVASFAAETDAILTHTSAVSVELQR